MPLLHGVRLKYTAVPFNRISELLKLSPEDETLDPVDTLNSPHVPIVTLVGKHYVLWQSNRLWKLTLSKQRPTNAYVLVSDLDNDPVLVSDIHEYIHFESLINLKTSPSELLLTLFTSPTLEKTICRLFFSGTEKLTYKQICEVIGDKSISASTIYRKRKEHNKIKPVTPEVRWNKFAKQNGHLQFDPVCKALGCISTEGKDWFIEQLKAPKAKLSDLSKKIMERLEEQCVNDEVSP